MPYFLKEWNKSNTYFMILFFQMNYMKLLSKLVISAAKSRCAQNLRLFPSLLLPTPGLGTQIYSVAKENEDKLNFPPVS